MTTYLGTDLLMIRPNGPDDAWTAEHTRVVRQAETDEGNVLTATTSAPPGQAFSLEWRCATRADLLAIRAVLDARSGRLVPIWIPTYQRDIDVLAVDTFWIKVPTASGGATFGALMGNAAWQYWFQWPPDPTLYRIRQFTSSTDNGDGTTKWNGTAQAGTDSALVTSANGRIWSRLRYCRMAEDSYREIYHGQAVVVTASFVEVAAP